MEKLNGRVTIVTGGGTGIGKAIEVRFAKEGANVALFLVSEEASYITGAIYAVDGGMGAL